MVLDLLRASHQPFLEARPASWLLAEFTFCTLTRGTQQTHFLLYISPHNPPAVGVSFGFGKVLLSPAGTAGSGANIKNQAVFFPCCFTAIPHSQPVHSSAEAYVVLAVRDESAVFLSGRECVLCGDSPGTVVLTPLLLYWSHVCCSKGHSALRVLHAGGTLCSGSAGRGVEPGSSSLPQRDLPGRGCLELLQQRRNFLSDPDPTPDWDVTCLFCVAMCFVVPGGVPW